MIAVPTKESCDGARAYCRDVIRHDADSLGPDGGRMEHDRSVEEVPVKAAGHQMIEVRWAFASVV